MRASSAASAQVDSAGSKPPACQGASAGQLSSPTLLFNPARHRVGRFAPPGLGAGRAGLFGVIPAMCSRLSGGFALAVDIGAGPDGRAPPSIGVPRRVWLSGSRAEGTWQPGSPGRGPQLTSQAPWSAKTASRSRHRSSGVTQCGWACVPRSPPAAPPPAGAQTARQPIRRAGSSTPPGSPRQSPSLSRSWSPVKCSSGCCIFGRRSGSQSQDGGKYAKGFSEGGDVALGKSSHVREHTAVQGAISLRTVAEEIPKSLATRAGLNPARTAARTMLALAGGTSGNGAALRMILVVTGRVSSATGAGLGLPFA